MSQQAAKEIARNVEESNNKNASQLKGGMGGSGCSPELTKQATGAMVAVMGVVDKVNRALTTTGSGLFSDDNLKKIYENAKNTNNNALLNEYIAEKNHMINRYGTSPDNLSKGTNEYDELLVNRFTAQGTKDLEELNNKYIEVNNLIMDLIKVIQQQKLAVENMQKVMENLDEKNEELLSIINGGKSDLHTYNRRSMYEGKLKERVDNWTFIPVIVYWTLVILWVCIVMLYLKNVTIVSVLILIGLILYPYFSTPIFLWILEKIQMVWNFIFAAVHNRITS
jgi:hypothetical protein